jgi:hypothetical protein
MRESVGDTSVYSSIAAAERGMEHWQLRHPRTLVDGNGCVLDARVGSGRAVQIDRTRQPADASALEPRLREELEDLGRPTVGTETLPELLSLIATALGLSD